MYWVDSNVVQSPNNFLLKPIGIIKECEVNLPGEDVLLLDRYFYEPHHISLWVISDIEITMYTIPKVVYPPEC